MKKEMLINVLQPEECRIAILEDGILEELYVERTSHESYVGNIYKGRIVNIEPSIQAAFVDFGVGRNGFLHVSDVEPTYYRHLEQFRSEGGPRLLRGRDRHRSGGIRSTHTGSGQHAVSTDEIDRETGSNASLPPNENLRDDLHLMEPGQEFADHADLEDRLGETGPSEQESQTTIGGNSQFMDFTERRTNREKSQGMPANPAAKVDDFDVFFPRGEQSDTDAISPDVELPSPEEQEVWPKDQAAEVNESEIAQEPDDQELQQDEPSIIGSEEEDPMSRPRRRPRDDRSGPRRGRRPFARPNLGRPKPLIQDIFRRGQEVLVQVIKEGIGTKGPTLSTYISIAGRYLVLMPGLNRIGVSRKIADDEQRRRLRDVLNELQPPKGLGFIIRTAGMDKNKKELQRDLAYLSRLWQVVVRRIRKLKGPAEIYQESDMITRTIRDTFTGEIDTICVDESSAFEHAQEFLQIVMPRYASRIKQYGDSEPLFHKYGIEDEIARIQLRHVPLPNGGSIVIDQTEALVAIDVNSGNFRADNNAEETAYQMNLLAAREIARQLRLRDLGGVIVNDFIDMREEKHRRGVERALREAVKRDRARTKILKISAFGIIEMTRQRIRPSLKRSVYQDCPHCVGTGQVKTCESMSIDVMRLIQLAAHRSSINRMQIEVADEVAHYLLNKKRAEIAKLEQLGNIQVNVAGAIGVPPEKLDFVCYDQNNNEIKLFGPNGRGLRR